MLSSSFFHEVIFNEIHSKRVAFNWNENDLSKIPHRYAGSTRNSRGNRKKNKTKQLESSVSREESGPLEAISSRDPLAHILAVDRNLKMGNCFFKTDEMKSTRLLIDCSLQGPSIGAPIDGPKRQMKAQKANELKRRLVGRGFGDP